MPKVLKIGLTGGLGSGKTFISKIFVTLGIPIFYADDISKNIISSDPSASQEIRLAFGEGVFDASGMLNRRALANLVFNDPFQLQRLNAILHPKVFKAFENWSSAQVAPYIIKEAAILFESGSYKGLDHVITVSSPMELRLRRVQERDNCSKEEFMARVSKQLNEEERIQRADFVIYNDEDRMLIPQVYALHEKLSLIHA